MTSGRRLWSIFIPVLGAVVIGLMARFGSSAIRGHGIPEAMEQILTNESRIPARITFLKPRSSAISLGTGGPFGAEGPIIATAGALGSVFGQILLITITSSRQLCPMALRRYNWGLTFSFSCCESRKAARTEPTYEPIADY